MKALLVLLALATSALAQNPVIIYRAPQSSTVVSPLTNSTAQSGQALLSQINNTITQRTFEHQVLTLNNPAGPLAPSDRPVLIQAK